MHRNGDDARLSGVLPIAKYREVMFYSRYNRRSRPITDFGCPKIIGTARAAVLSVVS